MDQQFLQIEKNLNAKSKIKRYKAILAWYYAHLINFEKQNLLLYWNKTTSPFSLTATLFLSKIDLPTLVIWRVGGFILVQLIKMSFVLNILHLIVGLLHPHFTHCLLPFFRYHFICFWYSPGYCFPSSNNSLVGSTFKDGQCEEKKRIQIRPTNLHNFASTIVWSE